MKIKNLLLSTLVLLLSANLASAQTMAEPKVQFSKVVNKSADELWKTVRKLDQVHKYSSAIAKVDWNGNMGVGGERICHTPDGKGYFKEKIVAYDESSRSFSYALLEGAPVKGMTNFMQVVDLGYGKCILVWWSNYDEFMKNPQMTEEQFQAFMLSSLEEMTEKWLKIHKRQCLIMCISNSGLSDNSNRFFV